MLVFVTFTLIQTSWVEVKSSLNIWNLCAKNIVKHLLEKVKENKKNQLKLHPL